MLFNLLIVSDCFDEIAIMFMLLCMLYEVSCYGGIVVRFIVKRGK